MVDWDVVGYLGMYSIIGTFAMLGLVVSFGIAGVTGGAYVVGFLLGCVFTWICYSFYLHARDTQQPARDSDPSSPSASGFTFPNADESDTARTATQSETSSSESASGHGKSRRTALIETIVPAGVGVLPAAFVAQIEISWPALALGVGALLVAIVLFFVRDRTYYAGGGALYCLLTAVAISVGFFPAGYSESPFAVLLILGLISGGIVSIQLGVGVIIQRLLSGVAGEQTAFRIYEAIAAILGLLGMIWAVINIHERAARYGGVTIGGTLGFVLNFLGIELPIPWIIASGVDATLVLYVGALLIGFHTLESLHTTWRASKATAQAGLSGARAGADKAAAVAATQRERYEEK